MVKTSEAKLTATQSHWMTLFALVALALVATGCKSVTADIPDHKLYGENERWE